MDRGLKEIYELLTQKALPFCFYAMPDSSIVKIVAQLDNETLLKDLEIEKNESGFIFRGFNPSDTLHMINPDFFGEITDFPWEIFQDLKDKKESKVDLINQQEILSKDQYLSNVSEVINAIKRGEAEKVVYARIKSIPNKKTPIEIFNYLASKHQHAFRYLLKTSDGQIWFGASPEILLAKTQSIFSDENTGEFETVALAGTVSHKLEQSLFEQKNEDEQHIVSRYIEKIITHNGGDNIRLSKPFASKASNVSHIKTNISFDFNDSNLRGMLKFSEALHPTPAVGGTPLNEALKFISDLEPSSRDLYAGYLGPYNLMDQTAFYVNIRCAQFFESEVILYIGGGITKNSDALKEWDETELKAKLMEEVIMNA